MLLAIGCHDAGSDRVKARRTAERAPGGGPSATAAVRELFRDVTAEVGIDFVHVAGGHPQDYFMPKLIGSGAAFLDADGDGRLDLYFLQNDGPNSELTNQLYLQTDKGFALVGPGSGLDIAGHGMGVACGDVNNDGRTDILLTEYGQARLLVNRSDVGHVRFEDVSAACGLHNPLQIPPGCALPPH